jgi:hypothetical protein
MPTITDEETMLKQAKFVFDGTVQKLKASNVREVIKADKENSVVVKIDDVVQAPAILANYEGQEITVKLSKDEKIRKGQRARFYTNGWIFSENIAVESLGHSDIENTMAATLSSSPGKPAKTFASQQMKERIETADVVVKGIVTGVRKPKKKTTQIAAAATTESPTRKRISEHDPKWREAVIKIEGVEKGSHKGKQVVVRFPQSNDVRWHKAPKFHEGQEGVFILHKKQETNAVPKAATLTVEDVEDDADFFTALHPADFQPATQQKNIKTLIKEVSGSGNN